MLIISFILLILLFVNGITVRCLSLIGPMTANYPKEKQIKLERSLLHISIAIAAIIFLLLFLSNSINTDIWSMIFFAIIGVMFAIIQFNIKNHRPTLNMEPFNNRAINFLVSNIIENYTFGFLWVNAILTILRTLGVS